MNLKIESPTAKKIALCQREGSPADRLRTTSFLKWAGGKRWLLRARPDLFELSFDRYIEPFLGSGSVFFHLAPARALLGDSNGELIDTFKAIQKQWHQVVLHLKRHQRLHNGDHYYRVRTSRPRSLASRAARLLYLNRTCWNALYRVNKKGAFNVPIGTKTTVISDADDFGAHSSLLSRATLHHADFECLINKATRGDFVFVDPPYTVRHDFNGFLKYNEVLFTWADQVRLRNAVLRATKRGAKFVITNAAHKSVADLYSSFAEIIPVQRRSVIAANKDCRGMFNEVIIKC